jgi:hypothetical protein
VLITDGEPNRGSFGQDNCGSTGDVANTTAEIQALANEGVPVYVLGFDGINAATMEGFAVAGGTNNPNDPNRRWFPVSLQADISAALSTIISAQISCTFDITPSGSGTPDYARSTIVTTIGGTARTLPRAEYTLSITASRTTLTVVPSVCNTLRAAAGSSPPPSVEVRAACTGTCPGTVEICGNLVDDDCDGLNDEGCDESCACGDTTPGCPTDCGVGCVPRPEVCGNAIDDDCDGQTDEGCCVPSPEICGNNIDDDCDGVIDEDCTCEPEICDGKDNDCDGAIDEGCGTPPPSCVCGVSKPGCEVTLRDCPPPGCNPSLEVCDGRDNDCDGQIDEGCCTPTTTDDQCDGMDNNCNGSIDEDCVCGPEVCDGRDNDCDDEIDEGCPGGIR